MLKRILMTLGAGVSSLVMLIILAMAEVIQLSPATLAASFVLIPIGLCWLAWITSLALLGRSDEAQCFISRADLISRLVKALLISGGIGLLGVIPFSSISPIFGIFVWLPICGLTGVPLLVMASVNRVGPDSASLISAALALDFALAASYSSFCINHNFFIIGAHAAVVLMGMIVFAGFAVLLRFGISRLLPTSRLIVGASLLVCGVVWFIAGVR